MSAEIIDLAKRRRWRDLEKRIASGEPFTMPVGKSPIAEATEAMSDTGLALAFALCGIVSVGYIDGETPPWPRLTS